MNRYQPIVEAIKRNKGQLNATLMMLNTYHNNAIRSGAKSNSTTLDNVYAKIILPIWVSQLELEFERVIYAWPEHSEPFISEIKSKRLAEATKWLKLIEFSARKSYGVAAEVDLNEISLGSTAFLRYTRLREVVESHIQTFIELRNRLAHGQWAIAMAYDGTSLNQDITSQIWVLTKKDLLLLKILVRDFPKICEELMKSQKGFEKIYDKNMKRIALAVRDKDLRYNFIKSRKRKKTA